jgi:hypothetical protein
MKKNEESKQEIVQIRSSLGLSVVERKKMLKKVLMTLKKAIKDVRVKSNKSKKKCHEVHEIRLRLYNIMKNLVYEKYEHNMCETETAQKLHILIDICKDHPEEPLHCFQVYTKHFVSYLTEGFLRKMVKLPGIRVFFINKLVEELFLRYEQLLTIISCLNELRESKEFIKQEFNDWEIIYNEIKDQLDLFNSLKPKLMRDDLIISRSVRTKNVGKSLVNFGHFLVENTFKRGEMSIDEKRLLDRILETINNKLKNVHGYVKKQYVNECKRIGKEPAREEYLASFANLRENLHMFVRKMNLVFPFMRKVENTDFDRLRKKAEYLKMSEKNNEALVFSKENKEEKKDMGIYFIKHGIFEVRSETNRLVGHLSKGDVFGGMHLVCHDVPLRIIPKSIGKIFHLPTDLVLEMMNKYPDIQKKIYKQAVFNYLKCCPSSLLKSKSKYFRRLRRFSGFYLKPLLKKGKIVTIRSKEELLNYICYFQYTSMGVFVLKGKFKVRKESLFLKPVQELVRINRSHMKSNFSMDGDQEEQVKFPVDNNQGSMSLNPEQVEEMRKKLDMLIKEDEKNGEHGNIKECFAGDAAEIHSFHLSEFEMISDVVIFYLIEVKRKGFTEIMEEKCIIGLDKYMAKKHTIRRNTKYV